MKLQGPIRLTNFHQSSLTKWWPASKVGGRQGLSGISERAKGARRQFTAKLAMRSRRLSLSRSGGPSPRHSGRKEMLSILSPWVATPTTKCTGRCVNMVNSFQWQACKRHLVTRCRWRQLSAGSSLSRKISRLRSKLEEGHPCIASASGAPSVAKTIIFDMQFLPKASFGPQSVDGVALCRAMAPTGRGSATTPPSQIEHKALASFRRTEKTDGSKQSLAPSRRWPRSHCAHAQLDSLLNLAA